MNDAAPRRQQLETLLHKVMAKRRPRPKMRSATTDLASPGSPTPRSVPGVSRSGPWTPPAAKPPSRPAGAPSSPARERTPALRQREAPAQVAAPRGAGELEPRRSGRPERMIGEPPTVLAITPDVDLQRFDNAQPFETIGTSRAPEPTTLEDLIIRSLELKPRG